MSARVSRLEWSDGGAGPILAAAIEPDWRTRGLCGKVGQPDDWFPEDGQNATQVKAVCRQCPVAAECLEFALYHGYDHGVWGGTSERERQRIRRQQHIRRRTGRPPIRCDHDRTEENVYTDPSGRERCRECQREDQRRRYRDRKTATSEKVAA